MGAAVGGSKGKRGGIVGINVTPMVDVVLVLLIIMMVSATYIASAAIKVELPKSASSDDNVPAVTRVTIMKDGKLLFNDKPCDETELVAGLKAAHDENGDMSLVISADGSALHGQVVHVIDLAKRESITKFAINIARD